MRIKLSISASANREKIQFKTLMTMKKLTIHTDIHIQCIRRTQVLQRKFSDQ